MFHLSGHLSEQALEAGRKWFREWIEEDYPDGGWDPRALNELCKTLELKQIDKKDPKAEFGAVATQLEGDVIIRFCLENAGYELHNLVGEKSVQN